MAEEQAVKSLEDRIAETVAPEYFRDEQEPEAEQEPVEQEVVEDATPGDEAEEAETAEEVEAEAPAQEFVELELNGKTYEVPIELQDGFLKQKDYTQKTQTLADERREVELQRQQIEVTQSQHKFVESIQEELNEINQIDYQLKQWEDYLSLNVKEMDAHQIAVTQNEIRLGEKQRDEKTEALKAKGAEFQQAQKQAVQDLLDKGTEVLKKQIPDWGPDKQKEMREYALADDYTENEISAVSDPRFIRTLWKAAQFDKLQSGVKGAVKKVEAAPTITPTARHEKMPKDVGRKLNFQKKLKSPKRTAKEKARLIQQEMGERLG